jgi:hypothetical protein
MRCPNCNSEVPEGKRFCGYCGQRLTPAEASPRAPLRDAFDDEAPTRVATHVPEGTPAESVSDLESARTGTAEKPEPSRPGRPAPASITRPNPPSKPRLPKWVWGIVGAAVVTLVVVVMRLNRGEQETYEPVPEGILMFETRDEIRLWTDQNLILGGNVWVADTEKLVSEYIESLQIALTLDGSALSDPTDYWSDVYACGDVDGDGDDDFASEWQHDLGTLSPGTHQLKITVRSQWPVIDGFDSDGDGELDEFDYYHEHRVSIIVEE